MPWWLHIDRDDELKALRELLPGGGCLVMEGDDEAGRPQAGDLAEHYLSERGYEVIRVDLGGRVASLKTYLQELWQRAAPPPAPTETPPWLLRAAGQTARSISREIEEIARRRSGFVAVIFDDIDGEVGLEQHDVEALARLASATGWPFVVTSIIDTSDWSSLPMGSRLLRLGDFTVEHVRAALTSAPELATMSMDKLDAALEVLIEASGGSSMFRPRTVYNLLQLWDARERPA
jgi:hypothetical protein